MTERTITLCDADRTDRHGWWTPADELPTSWETVTVPMRDGTTRTVHLCPRHRGARVDGETGGIHPRLNERSRTMAKLGPITGTLSLTIAGSAPIEVATFEVPLRTSSDTKRGDTSPTVEAKVDRTAFRDQLNDAFRAAAEHVDATFNGEPDGLVLLTCPDCGAKVSTNVLATLRHEADGAHVLDPQG